MPPGPGQDNLQPLSNDAIAGIAVGVVVIIALIGIFVLWLLRRRRQRTQKDDMIIPPAYAAKYDDLSKPAPVAQAREEPPAPASELQGLPLLPGPHELPTKLHRTDSDRQMNDSASTKEGSSASSKCNDTSSQK